MRINTNSYMDYIPISKQLIDEIIQEPQKGSGYKHLIKYLKYKKKYLAMQDTFISKRKNY
jgi:hypothetical protein